MTTFNNNESGLNVRNKINESINKTDLISVTGSVNLDNVSSPLLGNVSAYSEVILNDAVDGNTYRLKTINGILTVEQI